MRSRHVARMQKRAQLLDAKGQPVQSSSPIPFVRVYPDGLRSLQQIDRGEALYTLACKFISAGGRYGISIATDGTVDLVAVIKGPTGDDMLAAQEFAPNNSALLPAVDRLVKKSVAEVENMPQPEAAQ